MRQTRIAVCLFVAAGFLTFAFIVQLAHEHSTAEVIETTHDEATVFFEVANPLILFDCAHVRWAVDHVEAIKLNTKGVVGQGQKTICSDKVDLRVKFQDGTSQTYSLERKLVTDNLIRRAVIALIFCLFGLGLYLTGLPAAILSYLGRQPIARAIRTGLPVWRNQAIGGENRRLFLLAMVGVILIGGAIRAAYVTKSLRSDESSTYLFYASEPLSVGLSIYPSTNNHPFNTLLIHLSTEILGGNLLALRLPLYFAGILVIAAVFAVGRRFFNAYAGLFAAALAASAPWLIAYSADARGYMIATLMFLLLLLVASSLRRRRRFGLWMLFALFSIVGLYTLLTAAYTLGIVVIWLGLSIVIEKRGRERLLWLRDLAFTLILTLTITGLLYLPLWLYVRARDITQLDLASFDRLDPRVFLRLYSDVALQAWYGWNISWLPLSIILALGCLITLVAHSRLSRGRVSLLAACVVCLVPLLFVQMTTTYARNWVLLQPLYYVLGAAGILYVCRWIAPRWITSHPGRFASVILLLTALASVNGFQSQAIYSFQRVTDLSARETLQRIHNESEPGDTVLCTWFCISYKVYSRWDNIPLLSDSPRTRTFKHPSTVSVQVGQRLYLITRGSSPDPLGQVPLLLKKFHIPVSALVPDIAVIALSDTVVYRVQFTQPVTFTAYTN